MGALLVAFNTEIGYPVRLEGTKIYINYNVRSRLRLETCAHERVCGSDNGGGCVSAGEGGGRVGHSEE